MKKVKGIKVADILPGGMPRRIVPQAVFRPNQRRGGSAEQDPRRGLGRAIDAQWENVGFTPGDSE